MLLIAAAGVRLFSQGEGSNPFELTPRIPKVEIPAPKQPDTIAVNPFDIVALPGPGQTAVFADTLAQQAYVRTLAAAEEARYRRFLFATVLELFLILTILFTLFRSIPGRVYRAFLNDNLLGQLHREQGPIVSVPYFLFYLFFFFNAGLFLFLTAWENGVTLYDRHWMSFLVLTGGLAALFAGKHLLLKILGAVLPIEKELRIYSFTIIIFSIAVGILLIPFNLLIAYGPENAVSGVITMALVTISLVYAFRFIRGVFIAGRFVAVHLFHFLLYICTVEIAPALIVAKAIILAVTSA